MLAYKIKKDKHGHRYLETSIHGKALMCIPQLNKGLAFTHEERDAFGLHGKMPNRIETIEEQVKRSYLQFSSYSKKINKNLYLRQLQNTNQVLFYRLVREHLLEMIPIIYTPIVGNVVQEYNERYFQPRGLYISYEDRDRIEEILQNRTHPNVELIVASDGEGVLGIGDQGIGAMAIPVAKLMVYTAFAGIDPMNTLPIMLDAGTNNQTLLNDPYYLGWRHERVTGKEYDEFIEKFVIAVKKTFPHVFLHWEDFGRHNAYQNLERYREKISSFNDDIQGTGAVTLAAILAAIEKTNRPLAEQRIVIFGAGTAGIGVADNIYNALIRNGLSEKDARNLFWLIDRFGLLTENTKNITPTQQAYCRTTKSISDWETSDKNQITLEETIKEVKPTILIGCSAHPGAFHEKVIKEVASHHEHPIILPLSNPTEKSEATPKELLEWTNGKALIATGSPFDPVEYNGKTYHISQCNNYLAFPGIGLGVIAAGATRVNDDMLWAASKTLSEFAEHFNHRLLPDMNEAFDASTKVAEAVALAAIESGYSKIKKADIIKLIKSHQWNPEYLPYRRVKK